MFDPPAMVKYAQIPYSENDSPAHRALAVETARESIVLLKCASEESEPPAATLENDKNHRSNRPQCRRC
jgi:hypothetical protein